MPKIVFASNNVSHFPGSISSNTAGSFDATRVPYSFGMKQNETLNSPKFVPVLGEVTWFHHRLYVNDSQSGGLLYMSVRDDTGNVLFKLDAADMTYEYVLKVFLYNGAGSITGQQTVSFPGSIMNTVDVRYEQTASLLNVKLYINSILEVELNYGTNSSGFGKPNQFIISGGFNDFTSSMRVSEIIVADGDTRNARLSLLRPVAEAGETDWVGNVADLSDDDPTTGMTSLTAEQRQTMTIDAYTGASNIAALVVTSQAYAGANAPQNLRHTVRMSTVNYDGPADLPIGESLQYSLTDFDINPATSNPWVGADLAALEVGFVSKT